MTSVKCSIEDCGHRNRKGYCTRETIELSNEPHKLNELYCLGFDETRMKVFKQIISGDPDIFQK